MSPALRLAYLAAALLGAGLARWWNSRNWRRAETNVAEAGRLWGEKLRRDDERAETMLDLARRQTFATRVSLAISTVAVTVTTVDALGWV